MEYIYLIIFGLFVVFVISLIFSIVRFLWPVLLVLGIYIAYKYHKEKKRLESEFNYTASQNTTIHNSDVFEADFEVKKEEE